jgi:predicted nuclease with TOPRIM domain
LAGAPFPLFFGKMKTLNTNECVSKAGRHRLYSNEQRKDRNRQAQAAFRDRRSKYTKDLEAAVLKFEEKIKTLEETNSRTTERAQLAEDRCTQLNLEVTSLQKLLQITLADNQRLLQAQTTMNRKKKVSYYNLICC